MAEGMFSHMPDYGKQRSKLVTDSGFKEEEAEILVDQYGKTGYPEPLKTYRLSWEKYDLSMEEAYFWVLDTLKDAMPIVEKLEDSFSAAEQSSLFGASQTRLGAQQDKVSSFLAAIGQMIKQLFQMVRELRILDERLTYYEEEHAQLKKEINERSNSANVTLKGIFVDLVQGGGKSASSVFGMAAQLEFVTLPDLFFDAPPFRTVEEMEAHVKSLEKNFNKNVLRVLQRHFRHYMEWKKRTYHEHKNRKRFQLAYLKQHFEIIKMYTNWIKPYLRNVARLSMKEKNMQSADLVSAFEGSMIDIEVLARRRVEVGDSGANGCILATFNYRTRAEMKVVQEGYHRGPVQIGRMEMNFRIYGWTDEEVKKYKEMKDKETLMLLGNVSSTVEKSMTSLGKELDHYLKEAEGLNPEDWKEEGEKKKKGEKKPLIQKLFGDFYTPKEKDSEPKKSAKKFKAEQQKIQSEIKSLVGAAKFYAWGTFHNFKKAHGMIAW